MGSSQSTERRAPRRTFGAVTAAVVAALVLGACGNSRSGSASSPSNPETSTSSATATPSSTVTSSSPASGGTTASFAVASLPVLGCRTTFAVSTSTTSLPTSVSVSVPSGEADNLAVYSDPAGRMMLMGPKDGWSCSGMYGADGSGGLLLSPNGEAVPSDPDAGWHLSASSPIQAIVGYETGASPVQGAALACPLFSAAATAFQQDLGKGCSLSRPAQESVAGISSSANGFEDPAGVTGDGIPSGGQNAANGVVLYQPKSNEASASIATCTLPAAQHDVCTAVLNHFVAQYG
jgi:hypothetical protein